MDRVVPNDAAPPPVRRQAHPWLAAAGVTACVLILCLGLTWQLWRAAVGDARQEQQASFDFRARELINHLALRLSTHVQSLRGVQGLFASSDQVTRAEFAAFVHGQFPEQQPPGMQGMGYIELVGADRREAHLARVRAEGYPDYALLPDGARAEYAPIVYLEPFGGARLRSLGHDALAEAPMARALEQARDSGQPAMSGKMDTLAPNVAPNVAPNGTPLTADFLIALPLYRQGASVQNLAQRREACVGWVYAPFHMGQLLAGLGGERGANIGIAVYDGESRSPQALLAGTPVAPGAAHLYSQQALSTAGRRWTVVLSASPAYETRLNHERAHAILVTGLVASAVLAVLTWLLAQSNTTARAALQRSRSLARELESGTARLASLAESAQRAQAMLRNILDSTIDGVLVDNGDRRVLASNQRFRELWSVPPEIDVGGDDDAVLAHVLSQLVHTAPLLYSRSLQFQDGEERRDLLRLKDGRFFEQVTRAVRLGQERARLWSFRDITERKQIEQRERSHRHVLELLARGAPLQGILDAVVLGVESTNPGMLCSVLLLDADGRHLNTGAAPSLPAFFSQAVDGLLVGPGYGSCGSAVASGARVIAENIQTHPDWVNYREIAARAQLASSWSEPIRGASGRVLGTFAIYHRTPHFPSPANVVLIEQAAQLAGIALEQAQAAQALRAGEERFRSLYDNAPVALWEQDWSAVRSACTRLQADGARDLGAWLREWPLEARRLASLVRITDVNGAALVHVGAAAKDLGALALAQNFALAEDPAFIDAVAALAGGALFYECESSFLRLDGIVRQHELTLLVMPGHARTLDFVIVSTVDITERKRMDAELRVLATTDFLTGLPNRRVFMARLDDQLARLQRSVDECASVLMLDIDHFKRVNDLHGHAAGDAVLRHMAALMQAGQRKIDTLGRVGGEEFAVLLPGATAEAAAAYAERLRLAVAETPLELDGLHIPITVSIGIASIGAADTSPDAALIRADKALYRAKDTGRNRVCDLAA